VIAQGEYQLVNPALITSRSHRPNISLQTVPSSSAHLHHPLSSTPILALQRLPDSQAVDLPLSCQQEHSIPREESRQVDPKEYDSVPVPQERQYFAVNSRKEIEDVIYDKIPVTRSEISAKREQPSEHVRGVFWSRFETEDRNKVNPSYVDPPRTCGKEERERVLPVMPSVGTDNAIVSSMPVVRKSLSPSELDRSQGNIKPQLGVNPNVVVKFTHELSPITMTQSYIKKEEPAQKQLRQTTYFSTPVKQQSRQNQGIAAAQFDGPPVLAQKTAEQDRHSEHSKPKREEGYLSQVLSF
jgi:hypothetical protein